MPERAIFLDRDNTLIDNDGHLGDPSKVKLLPGAATALSALRGLGYRLIVVSNQSGVARGLFTEADVEAVNNEVNRQLRAKAGAYIDASYYCPYHPEAPLAEFRLDHDWRKPKPGMLLQATADFDLNLSESWMIGDQGRDIAAGAAAGCRTILLRDPQLTPATGADESFSITPNYVIKTLADAARIIAREGKHPAPVATPTEPQESELPEEEPEPPAEEPESPVKEPEPTEPVPAAIPPAPVEPQKPATPLITPESKPIPSPPAPAAETTTTVPPPLDQSANLLKEPHTPSPGGGGVLTSRVEQHLDELVVQLRQQNRNADLRPDFSFSNMAALLIQVFAIVCVVIALAKYFTLPVTFTGATAAQDVQFSILSQLAALFWVMAAAFLQGMVIALLLYAKNK